MSHPPSNFNPTSRVNRRSARNRNADSELQKALRLSNESYEKEQAQRKQAEQKLQKNIQRRQQAKMNATESFSQLIKLMDWQEMFVNRDVGVGLQNLGNSCFMNSVLQCLAYQPTFSQYLCESTHSKRCRKKGFCALCEMEKIIPQMLMGNEIVRPKKLFLSLPKINDLLSPGCQEDAHEFLQSLLDKLEITYDDQLRPHRKRDPANPIRNLFTGSSKTSIQCAKCRRFSVTKEPFCCISLDIDKTDVDLAEALEIFTRDELLRGDEKYMCDFCRKKRVAHKRMTLSEIPPILVLHFKRFSVQFHGAHHKQGTTKKIGAHVSFPETLDFKELENVIHNDDRETVLIDSEYELSAVLVHSGPKLGYGHYYALIRSPDNNWYRMNDMDVVPVGIERVLGEQGYMVFYKRKTKNLMKCQLKRMKASKSKSVSDDDSGTDSRNSEHKENDVDTDDMDISSPSSDKLPTKLCNSKLADLSVEELLDIKKELVVNVQKLKRIVNNPRNLRRTKIVEEAEDNLGIEEAKLQEIEDILSEKIKNGVDMDLQTEDYFSQRCTSDPVSTGSVVMVKEDPEYEEVDPLEAQENWNLNGMSDRCTYVHVPPMATRPELKGDSHRPWNGNDSPEAVEVFWPVQNI